eukprot:CAMPEP_0116132150 /NCGR_PEP_ID=MMETSP0329-20121206/9394_1 /TAXON_ID=697910 /ORGANISM="Pseudo-nitzschia arenysensis, Strain B593" /LENGTH=497 /DNA_ID=CAMNT_0003626645 /DNA_START=125 /DNA_END=1618 /DNA_ORIENTATION=+
MTKETETIAQGTKGYQSIPGLAGDEEEVLSLQEFINIPDRSKPKISRSLLGLAALLFVGVAGFLRHGEMGAQLKANLLQTSSTVESNELVFSSSSFDGDSTFDSSAIVLACRSNLDLLSESMTKQCRGKRDLPPMDFGNIALLNPALAESGDVCSPENKAAVGAFLDIMDKIIPEDLASPPLLVKALKALGITVVAGKAAIFVGIVIILVKTWVEIVCEGDGSSSSALRVEDVERIARYEIEKMYTDTYSAEIEMLFNTKLKDLGYGRTMLDLSNVADAFFLIAVKAVNLGVAGVDFVSNTAQTAILLMEAYYTAAEDFDDVGCCEWAVKRLDYYRDTSKALYAALRVSFEEYKARSLDESRWKPHKRKAWWCGNIFWGGWTNQHVVYAHADDGSIMAGAWSPGGVYLHCYSNDWHIQQAKKDLRPLVLDFFDKLEKEVFKPRYQTFYEGLGNDISWTCGGQPYTPGTPGTMYVTAGAPDCSIPGACERDLTDEDEL